jgi:hypothetical protein
VRYLSFYFLNAYANILSITQRRSRGNHHGDFLLPRQVLRDARILLRPEERPSVAHDRVPPGRHHLASAYLHHPFAQLLLHGASLDCSHGHLLHCAGYLFDHR